MSDDRIGILVEYVVKGQDDVKKADENLRKMKKTSTEQVTVTSQLTKGLKELSPALHAMGIGWLAAAGAVGVATGATLLALRSVDSYTNNLVNAGTIINSLGGTLMTYNELQAKSYDWATKLNITQGEALDGMAQFDKVTHNSGLSLNYLADAARIHMETGKGMNVVVAEMVARLTQFNQEVDASGRAIPPGTEALNQYIKKMDLLTNAAGQAKAAIGTVLGRQGEALGNPPPFPFLRKEDFEPGGFLGPKPKQPIMPPGQTVHPAVSTGPNMAQVIIQIAPNDEIGQAIAKSLHVQYNLQGGP